MSAIKYAVTEGRRSFGSVVFDQPQFELPITVRRVTAFNSKGYAYAVDTFSEGHDARFRVSEISVYGRRDELKLDELRWFGTLADAERYILERSAGR